MQSPIASPSSTPPKHESEQRDQPAARPSRWRRAARLAALLYLLLLGVSTAVRLIREPPPPPAGRHLTTVEAVRGDQLLPRPFELAWVSWEPEAGTDDLEGLERLPVVLLHGSPGSAYDFRTLGSELGHSRRVIAPDLPGFGASTGKAPDYSVRAHAGYVLQLLDQLGIARCHVVGFSMGGGVGLELWNLAPARVASLTMLSSIGVEELELFGDHTLNHAVHGMQLWLLRLLRWGVPHFGVLDHFPLGEPYARNFYDTDQRRLRDILSRFQPPLLIVHGKDDFLVPREAAEEHHRLAPQSRLVVLPGSHFLVFRLGDQLAREQIEPFLEEVDSGRALRRRDADPALLEAAGEPFDRTRLPPFQGPALLVALVGLAVATFVSEDLTCIGAGLLVALGRLAFWPATIACYVGIVVGDFLLYLTGRLLGRPIVQRAPLKWWLTPAALQRASAWLRRRGAVVILGCRFVPGSRLPTSVAAGVLRTNALLFLLYFALAALPWTPLIVLASSKLGSAALPLLKRTQWGLAGALLALILLFVFVRTIGVPMLTWRGRRRLLGRLRRLRHWEFWPPWVFYPPVLLYVAWLGLRYRSPTLFAAVNPAIPAGGFVGESKSQILAELPEEVVPVWRAFSADTPEQLLEAIDEFCASHDVTLPVALKPDVGQRSRGVEIVRQPEDARRYFETYRPAGRRLIVQRFVAGIEYGVFWARGPDDGHGTILSITEKVKPEVVGDGRRSLEELILADERAVAISSTYLAENPSAHEIVPAAGERVALVDVGAHARGAVFLDAGRLRSEALEQALGAIASAYGGFDFGRFDLIVPSPAALEAGRDLQVIEVNGVTSESTHIYDPRHSVIVAYRTLFSQWRRAFEIGAQRRARGHHPPPLRHLLAMTLEFWRAP